MFGVTVRTWDTLPAPNFVRITEGDLSFMDKCHDSPLILEWPSLSRRCLCHDPSLVCVGPLFSACGGGLFHVTLGLVLKLVKLVRWLLGRVWLVQPISVYRRMCIRPAAKSFLLRVLRMRSSYKCHSGVAGKLVDCCIWSVSLPFEVVAGVCYVLALLSRVVRKVSRSSS